MIGLENMARSISRFMSREEEDWDDFKYALQANSTRKVDADFYVGYQRKDGHIFTPRATFTSATTRSWSFPKHTDVYPGVTVDDPSDDSVMEVTGRAFMTFQHRLDDLRDIGILADLFFKGNPVQTGDYLDLLEKCVVSRYENY